MPVTRSPAAHTLIQYCHAGMPTLWQDRRLAREWDWVLVILHRQGSSTSAHVSCLICLHLSLMLPHILCLLHLLLFGLFVFLLPFSLLSSSASSFVSFFRHFRHFLHFLLFFPIFVFHLLNISFLVCFSHPSSSFCSSTACFPHPAPVAHALLPPLYYISLITQFPVKFYTVFNTMWAFGILQYYFLNNM